MPVTSYCMINVVAEDATGTAQCAGGALDLAIPLRSVFYMNGDLFESSAPPDLPGVQPCPLCNYLCQGGSKDRFLCGDDSQCPGGACGTSTECLGSIDDALLCTSDAECADGDEYESCVQRDPGAFSEPASTRITVGGSSGGECLADGQPYPADLVSIFCIPPILDATMDAVGNLPGPGVALL